MKATRAYAAHGFSLEGIDETRKVLVAANIPMATDSVCLVPPGEDGMIVTEGDGVPAAARHEPHGFVREKLNARGDRATSVAAVA